MNAAHSVGRISARKPSVALLEIGQSPSPEMEAQFQRVLGQNFSIACVGALDDYSRDEILLMSPLPDEECLFTTLPPDDKPVFIPKSTVVQGLILRLEELRVVDIAAGVLCCTGPFPELSGYEILTASKIVEDAVTARMPNQQDLLGLFVPDESQVSMIEARWAELGYQTTISPVSPLATRQEIVDATRKLHEKEPKLVVYDCMGYESAFRDESQATAECDHVLAIEAAAQAVVQAAQKKDRARSTQGTAQ